MAFAAVPAAAQSPPQTPAAPAPVAGQVAATPAQPAVPASRRFTSDAGIMFSVIKPDKLPTSKP